MNKRILTLVLASFLLVFQSCEKEEDSAQPEISTQSKSKSFDNKFLGTYKALDCTITYSDGTTAEGSICSYCAGCSSVCSKSTKCTKGNYIEAIIRDNFTPEEVENWGSGNVLNATDADYINDHYGFYMYMHTINDTFLHPDTIIAINGW